MADDKTKTGGADRARINTNEAYELRDWAEKFGTSQEAVRAAVKVVGPLAKDVESHLRNEKSAPNRPS